MATRIMYACHAVQRIDRWTEMEQIVWTRTMIQQDVVLNAKY